MADTLNVSDMLPNKFEPKRKFRWVFAIEGIDAYLMKTAARPTINTAEQEISFMNSTRYLAGKTKFDAISCTLHDPIAPSGAQQVMEWVRTHFESVSGRQTPKPRRTVSATAHVPTPLRCTGRGW